jgi:hypothetical protein
LLLTGDRERALEIGFGFSRIPLRRFERDFSSDAIGLGLRTTFLWPFRSPSSAANVPAGLSLTFWKPAAPIATRVSQDKRRRGIGPHREAGPDGAHHGRPQTLSARRAQP